ncbi:hypothetical protein [Burkholderia vietnamiensis]|uniref:hypothetical protein n=1 Tax=Burkholderia vietnamiensis TaxID=60552 RepID=UPI001588B261|nr:hypothetical protein [Burkholderia vietnamiensis]
MKGTARKYTYERPRFITSPIQDYSIQPETYRRYINHIIGFYVFFGLAFSFVLNFAINKIVQFLFSGSFNIAKVFMFFIGKEDEENKILYGLFIAVFFAVIYFPTKKLTYYFTKPVNRVEIEEGLVLIKGSNVFEELEQAFNEMNEQ